MLVLIDLLINGEDYLKSQNLSKHGVNNGIAMATNWCKEIGKQSLLSGKA